MVRTHLGLWKADQSIFEFGFDLGEIFDHIVGKFWVKILGFLYFKSMHPWWMCLPIKEFYLIVPLRAPRCMQIFDPDCNLTPTNTCLNIFKWLLTHEV